MTLLVVIPIAFILLVLLWIRNVRLYQKNFVDLGTLSLHMVDMYNVLNAPPAYKPLEASQNFFNYTANLILKFIHFVIFSVITFVFRKYIVVKIILIVVYVIFAALAYMTYGVRRRFYNEIEEETFKKAFLPILKASACIPIYQQVILILLLFV